MTDPRRPLSLLLVGAALTFVGPPGCGGDETKTPTSTTSARGGAGGAGTTSTETGGSSTMPGGSGGGTSSASGGSGGSGSAHVNVPLVSQGLSATLQGKSASYRMILAVGAPADPVKASSDHHILQCIPADQGSVSP